jgi:hypothetical protein
LKPGGLQKVTGFIFCKFSIHTFTLFLMDQTAYMGLEKDINQKRFRNERQKAMINLTYTHNWMSERFKKFLDKFDLTSQQFNILRILRGAGTPLSTLQIRERMLDKMSDTSRIVDRLILKTWLGKLLVPTINVWWM